MDADKYDRQIRLWGVNGQKAIQDAVICLFGTDAVATEFAKNLCLHAVGHIILVDNAKVSEEDVGVNYFVEPEKIGENRAEVVAALLSEMNPDPEINVIIKDPEDISVLDDPAIPEGAIILTYGIHTIEKLKAISEKVRARNLKQIHIDTTGFYGAIYMDAGQHYFFEGGFEGQDPQDYRVHAPWPELKEFFESYNLETDIDIPFPAILYLARKHVMEEKGYKTIGFKELRDIRDYISKFVNKPGLDESAPEALRFQMAALDSYILKEFTRDAFEICDTMPENDFWLTVRATKKFYERHGALPHHGGFPDCECSTQTFKRLKDIYAAKFNADLEEVLKDAPGVDREVAARYLKNSFRAGGLAFKTVAEYAEEGRQFFDDRSKGVAALQAVFAASRDFLSETGHVPKKGDHMRVAELALKRTDAPSEEVSKVAEEFCRFDGAVLPSVLASVAAVAAEEATKVIIKQGNPFKGVLIFDTLRGYILGN